MTQLGSQARYVAGLLMRTGWCSVSAAIPSHVVVLGKTVFGRHNLVHGYSFALDPFPAV
jgi:hypothetical protein